VCTALCTTVAHNIAQNRPDNCPSYPPDNRHLPMMSIWRKGRCSPGKWLLQQRQCWQWCV